MTDHPDKDDKENLVRRGDNVGQSGRWRREDGRDPGERRYGNEERWHDSEHSAGEPAEDEPRQPNADKPNTGPYARGSHEEGEHRGDDTARYPAKGYSDAGGKEGSDKPQHPGERWKDEGGAGFGEKYGEGRDKKPSPKAE
jgi:hypothetical protein